MTADTTNYQLDDTGSFVIKNYNDAMPFSNFFPGIAGLWGIPMWAFYVNRGQCMASFGIESKDKAILEFQPANKAYRLTTLQGFRTFIKVTDGEDTFYWEPFQGNLLGTHFQKEVSMRINAHDLTLIEKNADLGIDIIVNYFTLPEEPFAALVRKVTLRNHSGKDLQIKILDGLPAIIPFGMSDWLMKHLARTIEAWTKVRNMENQAPFYQLNVEVSDTPQVTYIEEGNFFFSFNAATEELLTPVVESKLIFGQASDFSAPTEFINHDFKVPGKQETSNRTPSAFALDAFKLADGGANGIISLYGHTHDVDQLNRIVMQVKEKSFIEKKAERNVDLINEIRNLAFTKSSSDTFDKYVTHTFLDNVLRGGLPVSFKTEEGNVAFNVYSRKHGDLERDYNFFFVAPTYYSQGNGNFRDVNQNRRNDVLFNTDVKDGHLVNFFNLSQADGYNPLVVKGTTFVIEDKNVLDKFLAKWTNEEGQTTLTEYLKENYLIGDLLNLVHKQEVVIHGEIKDFLGALIKISSSQELAEHGEGFWSDHWTYNLDLVESFAAVYPEKLRALLIEDKRFCFYHNSHYVLPRDERYVLTDKGVRQYESVGKDESLVNAEDHIPRLKTKNGEGNIYHTNLTVKILCLLANKIATLDPSNIGVEMEADKPNWYDALNGLPGLIGSSISETIEIKRYAQFLLDALKRAELEEDAKVEIFEECASFVSGLTNILGMDDDALTYWKKANDLKEGYRKRIRGGITGDEKPLTLTEIKTFLTKAINKVDQALVLARENIGLLPTYFYHDVVQYEELDKGREGTKHVRPTEFQRHDLPLYLEGYVHLLRSTKDVDKARAIYEEVRKSPLFDEKLKMYKVNHDISSETEEIGRCRIFPSGWLENESIWLHMEYKFLLELLRSGCVQAFYDNLQNVLVPFLNPEVYGRSPLENCSFIVSSAHEDDSLHGRGFVARLSGSTAELMHIWLMMNCGPQPFQVNVKNELTLKFQPQLPASYFTKEKSTIQPNATAQEESLPENSYAFIFLGTTLVVYNNPQRKDTFGDDAAQIVKMALQIDGQKNAVEVNGDTLSQEYAKAVRSGKVFRIDVWFE